MANLSGQLNGDSNVATDALGFHYGAGLQYVIMKIYLSHCLWKTLIPMQMILMVTFSETSMTDFIIWEFK